MSTALDWAGKSGDSWADRWRDTDRALAGLALVLDAQLVKAARDGPFRSLDVGCGHGSTSLALAAARPDAAIVGCDLSAALLEVARTRAEGLPGVRFVLGAAEGVASAEGPFDLIFSRHGVMFFADPVDAYTKLRQAAAPGASFIFSCFQSWQANPWASELAAAASGTPLPAPGREPSGFAFAEPAYVEGILHASGWTDACLSPVPFRYVAGEGGQPVDKALSFLAEIGPASRVLKELAHTDQHAALQRMRGVLERYRRDDRIEFPAAAWIWRATSSGA